MRKSFSGQGWEGKSCSWAHGENLGVYIPSADCIPGKLFPVFIFCLFVSPSHFCSTLCFVVLGPEFIWYGNTTEALVTTVALYEYQWLKAWLILF